MSTVSGLPEYGVAQSRLSDDLLLLVAGGPGAWMAMLRSAGGFSNSSVTKKIELPKNWDKLVAKYKGIVPNYERY